MRGSLAKLGFIYMLNAILLLSGQYVERSVTSNQLQFHDFVPRSTMRSPLILHTAQLQIQEDLTRKSRGFQFSSNDDTINVEFEVFLPLVKLPIESTIALLKRTVRKVANLNIDILGTVVAFILLSGSLALILKLFAIYTAELKDAHKPRRQLRTTEPFSNTKIDQSVAMFGHQYYIDDHWRNIWTKSEPNIRNCLQYYLCGEISTIANDTRSGRGGSYQKIIDGLISLQLMQMVLNGTVLMKIIETAYSTDGCTNRYTACNWSSIPIDPFSIWFLNIKHFQKLFY